MSVRQKKSKLQIKGVVSISFLHAIGIVRSLASKVDVHGTLAKTQQKYRKCSIMCVTNTMVLVPNCGVYRCTGHPLQSFVVFFLCIIKMYAVTI